MSGPVLIPCGGSGLRWQNYRGTPKQLALIDGVPLLELLARTLRAAGAGPVAVVATGERFRPPSVALLPPNPERLGTDLDKLHSTRPYWSPHWRTWIVWGDLFLTPAAARTMLAPDQPPLVWYGRSNRGLYTGKPYGELWGLSYLPSEHERLEQATRGCSAHCAQSGEPGRAWLVRGVLGGPLVEINDRTEDFDFPRDLVAWEASALTGRLERKC